MKGLDLPSVRLRKCPAQGEKVAEGRLDLRAGKGCGGSRAGQHSFLWPGLPQLRPPVAHRCGETCQTSPEPRSGSRMGGTQQESSTGRFQRGSSRAASPGRRSLHCLGPGEVLRLNFLSLECSASGPPSSPFPSCLDSQPTVSLCHLTKKPGARLRNKIEGGEGSEMTETLHRPCETKKPLLGKKDFAPARQESCLGWAGLL